MSTKVRFSCIGCTLLTYLWANRKLLLGRTRRPFPPHGVWDLGLRTPDASWLVLPGGVRDWGQELLLGWSFLVGLGTGARNSFLAGPSWWGWDWGQDLLLGWSFLVGLRLGPGSPSLAGPSWWGWDWGQDPLLGWSFLVGLGLGPGTLSCLVVPSWSCLEP